MLLVIDVGNTNMVFGVFDGEKLIANWRLSTQSGRTADETGLMIRHLFQYSDVSVDDIEAVIVSSVVPNAETTSNTLIPKISTIPKIAKICFAFFILFSYLLVYNTCTIIAFYGI